MNGGQDSQFVFKTVEDERKKEHRSRSIQTRRSEQLFRQHETTFLLLRSISLVIEQPFIGKKGVLFPGDY